MIIKYIEYKGSTYPVRIAYRALMMLEEETGKSFQDMQKEENVPIKMYQTLLFHSLVAGANAKEVKMTLKEDQMIDVLDECFMDFVEMIPAFFPEGKVGNVPKNRSQRRKQGKT